MIRAPIERGFDLSRSVDVHVASTAATKERAIGGVNSGLLKFGDRVVWEAVYFGIRQKLEVEITEMTSPISFTDAQAKGNFRHFTHTHRFETKGDETLMTDEEERNLEIKRIAENET